MGVPHLRTGNDSVIITAEFGFF